MSDPSKQDAPRLGDPLDADLGDETAAFLLSGGRPPAHGDSDAAPTEQTMETPDDLGGTGGRQEGGAG